MTLLNRATTSPRRYPKAYSSDVELTLSNVNGEEWTFYLPRAVAEDLSASLWLSLHVEGTDYVPGPECPSPCDCSGNIHEIIAPRL